MVKHLFENFLASESEYEASLRLWRSVIRNTALRTGRGDEWRPWRPTTFVNGTPISRDGEPICDAFSRQLHRAVTIMQHPPESNSVDIAAWIVVRDWADEHGPVRTDDLTINIALSEESLELAKQLITRWMEPTMSRERMEDVIGEYLPMREQS